MKILITGDWHLTDQTPENRIDDYLDSQFKKIKWIIELATTNNCRFILQPGDMFDKYKISDRIKSWYIRLFRHTGIPIYSIPGQHDLRYHNAAIEDTPMYLMESSGVVIILRSGQHETYNTSYGTCGLYGAGWEQQIPQPKKADIFNILITHKMIVENIKLWEGQKDYTMAGGLLRNHNFDLIVSGDNHKSFIQTHANKTLINCGSLMRSTSAQLNHKPCVYIYNMLTREAKKYIIPVQSIDDVMRINDIETEKEQQRELNAFVEKLDTNTEITGLDFKKNLIEYMKENNIEPDVEKIISEEIGGQ